MAGLFLSSDARANVSAVSSLLFSLDVDVPDTTYFVALPFIDGEDGPAPVEAIECQSAAAARAAASSLSRNPKYVGAVAFQRTGDPEAGEFNDAQVIARFGITPEDLSGL